MRSFIRLLFLLLKHCVSQPSGHSFKVHPKARDTQSKTVIDFLPVGLLHHTLLLDFLLSNLGFFVFQFHIRLLGADCQTATPDEAIAEVYHTYSCTFSNWYLYLFAPSSHRYIHLSIPYLTCVSEIKYLFSLPSSTVSARTSPRGRLSQHCRRRGTRRSPSCGQCTFWGLASSPYCWAPGKSTMERARSLWWF